MMSSDESRLHATLSIPLALHLLAIRPEGAGAIPFPILLAMHGYAMDAHDVVLRGACGTCRAA